MGFLSWIGEKSNHNKALSLRTHPNALGMGYGKRLLSREHFVKFAQPLVRTQIRKLREWDVIAGQRPDKIIANSKFVKNRIKKYWARDSEVVYPPVEVTEEGNYESHGAFVSICRLVTFKRVDLIIGAFNKLPEKNLIIIGIGPELARLRMIAKENIMLLGRVTDKKKFDILRGARVLFRLQKRTLEFHLLKRKPAGFQLLHLAKGALETVIDAQSNDNPRSLFQTI